jgi:transcriptional regulator with XRE-family HTH domain/Zn-dependent peptidase ImmA (M78 family)
MQQNAQSLGSRLRQLRLANGKSQSELATALGVSRSTVAQMELGNRLVRAEDIDRLAGVYGCSADSLFVSPEQGARRDADDLLANVAQTIPELGTDTRALAELSEAVAISRALTEVERTLGLDCYLSEPPSYQFKAPSTSWEAVHQGYVAAEEERRRMNLGDAPIRDVDETFATCRVRATRIAMPERISSLFLQTAGTGILIVVNRLLPVEKRRFQYAHGYAHAFFDREHRWLACRLDDQQSLSESRACAFASRFIVPETGVRRYLHSLGKDTLGRSGGIVQKLFSERVGSSSVERKPIRVDGRNRRGATPINSCDLTQIACYYGVSRSLAAHSLRNLRYMTEDEFEAVERQEAEGTTARTQEALDLRIADVESGRDAFRSRLLALTVEELRRGDIDQERFSELALLVGLTDSEQQALLDSVET